MKRFLLSVSFALFFLITTPRATYSAVPSFPGAEGHGAVSVGGRGGKVYEVTNLNDSGTGSLRECVSASGPRYCIFKIGGSITLESDLVISNPYITIAGQTAPGDGILLRKRGGTGDLIKISTHDVIIRFLTLRRGPPTNVADTNGIAIYRNNATDIYNIMLDHLSLSWTNDRILYTWYGPYNISIQRSIFSEPFSCNRNSKSCVDNYGAKAVMLGSGLVGQDSGSAGSGAKNISFHHNLIAHSGERNPLVKTAGVADVISNVVYNVSPTYAHLDGDIQLADFPVNFISNYFRSGPNGSSEYGVKMSLTGKRALVYLEGNIDSRRKDNSYAENLVMNPKNSSFYTLVGSKNTSNPTYPVSVTKCDSDPNFGGKCNVYQELIEKSNVGNNYGLDGNGNFYLRSDPIDQRILAEVKTKTGKVIDAPSMNTCWSSVTNCKVLNLTDYTKHGISVNKIETNDSWFYGWPIISNGTAYTDSDHDGMSDSWEIKNGLNPNDANDGKLDKNGDGYTNLENFLNGGATVTEIKLVGDINEDKNINVIDLGIMIDNFGSNPASDVRADLNKDGRIDQNDLGILIQNYTNR